MKDISELNPHNYKVNDNQKKNLQILFDRVMAIQEAYGKDFHITSGLRSEEQQQELVSQGKTNAKHSKHCAGAACDVYDPDGELKKWAKENLDIFRVTGIWLEHFDYTPTWLHMQILPPKSGKLVFIP